MENEGIKKIAVLIMTADVAHEQIKEAEASEPETKEAGLGSFVRGVGTSIGDKASTLASQIARSRAGLPVAGGLAGAGVATPFALGQFAEGDIGEGLAALGAGAGMGTGAGFLGRGLVNATGAIDQFKDLSKWEKIKAALAGKV